MLPLVVFGSLSVLGGIAALFLPETLGTHLPNTLDEGESFGSRFGICRCPYKDRYFYLKTIQRLNYYFLVIGTLRLNPEYNIFPLLIAPILTMLTTKSKHSYYIHQNSAQIIAHQNYRYL